MRQPRPRNVAGPLLLALGLALVGAITSSGVLLVIAWVIGIAVLVFLWAVHMGDDQG